MSRRERLAAAIDRLADVIPGGHLMAATDPAELLTQAADAITATARVVEAAMEWRAAEIELMRIPYGEADAREARLMLLAAVDALIAAREGR